MATTTTNQDITVRGGTVNVPTPRVHHLPLRHRPNTPVRKLRAPPVAKPDPPQPPAADPPDPPEAVTEPVTEE